MSYYALNILMRAKEFINEAVTHIVKNGLKLPKESEASLPGTHRVAGTADRLYDLNRVMQFVAIADGINFPPVPQQSWAGRNNTAHPYTKVEAEMLKHAYRMANIDWEDALKPNPHNRSEELTDTHTVSPIKSFKGYKRK